MKLTVKNFGPIREARNVEISPMTIFVGPSNTGKSYLAMLIYSIIKVVAEDGYAWGMINRIRGGRKNYPEQSANPGKSQNSEPAEIGISFSIWAEAISDAWKHQLVYCFGEEGKNLIEGKNGGNDFSVRISDHENQLVLDLTSPTNSRLTPQKQKQLFKSINAEVILRLTDDHKEYTGEDATEEPDDNELFAAFFDDYYPEIILEQFQTILLPWIPPGLLNDAYYLPAVRGGIMQSHRTLVSTLIERAPMAGLSDTLPIPLFNGVFSDFLKKLINISNEGYGRTKTRHLRGSRQSSYTVSDIRQEEQQKITEFGRKNIEQHILHGEIDVQRSEARYPDFRYKYKEGDRKYDIPVMNASSSVSELAPVSLFMRHYVCPGDLFIVEEPEAHLHPAAQRKISDVLVQLSNVGVKVLVTTHSDNVMEQISNYVYAADLPGSKLTKLDEEKCSVYLFKPGKGGKKTTVKKIPFDPETGLLTQDHLDVSSSLYNETVELMEQRDNAGSQTDIS